MFKRMSIILVLALLAASLLTACGAPPAPVALSSLPVFTGAAESTNEQLLALSQQALDAGKAADPNMKSLEIKVFDLPADTTFDALKAFYTPALEKAGWTTIASAPAPTLAFNRGNQQVAITHIEALNAVMVMLAEKK
jgi:hypothetical protein